VNGQPATAARCRRWAVGRMRVAGRLATGLVAVGLAAASAATEPANASAAAASPANAASLPSFAELRARWTPSDATLLDRQGQPLASKRLDEAGRRLDWVALDEVSPALPQALLLAEDRRFFDHAGVDWSAVASALWAAGTRSGSGSSGGSGTTSAGPRGASTLSMQLAALLNPALARGGQARDLGRKWDQMQAARALEQQWTKPQILEAYLNTVTFRGELQGLAAASWGLFDKAPSGLDRRDSAVLAALIRAPQAAPALVARRACALLATTRGGPCDAALIAAQLAGARQVPQPLAALAPHTAQRLLSQPGPLTSSLDASAQRLVRDALWAQVALLHAQGVTDAAAVVLDNRSGQVLAHVGSSGGFSRASQVDAALAPRQAGSTLKPFLYALAFEQQRLSPASLLDDSPLALATDAGLYTPQNYDQRFAGPVSVRRALAGSLNIPAVRTVLLTGVPAFHGLLRQLGLDTLATDPAHHGPALALGAADVTLLALTNAYRTLANGGEASAVQWRADAPPGPRQRLLQPASAWLVGHILADNSARAGTFGFDSALATPFWTAVKTGTSKDMRDNWCVGWSQHITVGVWVGNAAGAPMRDVSGTSGAAPAWASIMRGLHAQRSSSAPPVPAGLVQRAVLLDGVAEAGRTEWFQAALAPPAPAAGGPVRIALADGAGAPRLTHPAPGSLLAWDPDIPARHQAVLARRSGLGPGQRCLHDGQPLPEDAAEARLPLRAGNHQLQLLDSHGRVLDALQYEVRGVPAGAGASDGAAP